MQDTGQILATTEARTWPSPQMAWKLGHLSEPLRCETTSLELIRAWMNPSELHAQFPLPAINPLAMRAPQSEPLRFKESLS